ncbi:MAG TPA: phosphopantothenoylcysteine decarboxylase [Anaerovoracaceae bacterium]|nr:phosphopantothenoylcysteine decarboxylase [Anaerovoracaceae bacterium]
MKIIITGGPTNEHIDEIMKITNMSTGGMAVSLGRLFYDAGYDVVLILNNSVRAMKDSNLKIVRVETADEMLKAIEHEAESDNVDAFIHASAVGDYKAEFSFLMEDIADEIFTNIKNFDSVDDVLKVLKNPKCKLDDSSKISSYQGNLTVKLTMTPKIIEKLRFWYPNSILVGCKLLDNVSKGELFDTATALCNKNDMDYILANDLKDLKNGHGERYLINKEGFTEMVLSDYDAIYQLINDKLKHRGK